ncbi:MAG: hypothetical protein ABI180_00075 [Microcoleus sp.]
MRSGLSIFVGLERTHQRNRVCGSRLIPEMTYFGVSTRLLRQFDFFDRTIGKIEVFTITLINISTHSYF